MNKETKNIIISRFNKRLKERGLLIPLRIKFTKKRINITFGYTVSMLLKDGIYDPLDLEALDLYIDEVEENLKNVKPYTVKKPKDN